MFRLIPLTFRRAREERLPQVAGSLTFTTLLSLVPLLAVSFALFTRVPALRGAGQAIQQHLISGLVPAEISRTVLNYLGQFTANTGGLTPLGAVFVVAAAFATVFSVEKALNRIWQVRKERPLPRRLLLHVLMLCVAPVLLGASLWGTSSLQSASGGLLRTWPASAAWVLNVGPVVLGAVGFAALFRFVPNARVRWRDAIGGGLLAAIAFELGKRGFAFYLLHVPTYKTLYGAFAPLLAFLIWVFYSWLITLAAALVAATIPRAGRQPARRLSRA